MTRILSLLSGAALALGLLMAHPSQVQARGLPQFADLVEAAGPAVVNIRTTARAQRSRFSIPEGFENDERFEFFRRGPDRDRKPGEEGPQRPRGVGSGFILTADGFVLTNHHVVAGADEIFVTMTDKREFKAELIGSDKRTDVAVVKLDATSLPHLPIGDPDKLRVGEWVLAIGSPFGLANTVTAGIVSAKGRDTGDYLPFIQTDVAVNPGNSGGPLINMKGEVVGINSQIYSRTGGFMGISFAIPINEAMSIADQLRNGGTVVRGRIGVGIAPVTKEVAKGLGLPKASGALVRSVVADAPAEGGGTEPGDIILEFDGREITKASDLPRIVGATKPGTKVDMVVWRKGERKTLSLTVGQMPADPTAAKAKPKAAETPKLADASNALGIGVVELPDSVAKKLRIKKGVLVEKVEGPAKEANLRKGDVVLAINNDEIDAVPKFNAVVAKLPAGKSVILLIQRGDAAEYVPVSPR